MKITYGVVSSCLRARRIWRRRKYLPVGTLTLARGLADWALMLRLSFEAVGSYEKEEPRAARQCHRLLIFRRRRGGYSIALSIKRRCRLCAVGVRRAALRARRRESIRWCRSPSKAYNVGGGISNIMWVMASARSKNGGLRHLAPETGMRKLKWGGERY